jgi:NADH-quinone oxidoreductase subunit N
MIAQLPSLSWADLTPMWIELSVVGTFLVVFAADLLLGREEKRGLGALTAMGLGAILIATFFCKAQGTSFYGAYVADGMSMYFKQVLLLAGIIGSLGSIDHADRTMPARQGEHYMMILCSLIGMLILTGVSDLLLFIVAFELAGIPLVVLVGMHKTKRSSESSLKLYLSGAASSVMVLYGVSFLWGVAGDTAFASLATATASPIFHLGCLLLLAGVSFKLGLVPFHLWIADAYQGAPTPAVAFISVAPKIAVLAALARLLSEGLSGLVALWLPVLIGLSVLTMVVGNLTAVTQRDARRLLALSGVGHMGLLLLALAIGGVDGNSTLMFYSLSYVVTNMGAFLVVSVVVDARGDADLSRFNGLSQSSPAVSVAMLAFLFSLGGIPFMAGFWAKVFVFRAAWMAGHAPVVVLGVLLAVLALFYYLRIAKAIYIEKAEEGAAPLILRRATIAALLICVVGTVGIGLYPGPFLETAENVSAHLPAFTMPLPK